MKKELMYVAPEAEVLSAQVEMGFLGSGDGDDSYEQPGIGGGF